MNNVTLIAKISTQPIVDEAAESIKFNCNDMTNKGVWFYVSVPRRVYRRCFVEDFQVGDEVMVVGNIARCMVNGEENGAFILHARTLRRLASGDDYLEDVA